MRIGAVSDTHGVLPEPGGWADFDLFIHAGDAAPSPHNSNADRDLQRQWLPAFVEWFDAVPAREKVFVPGNHDLFIDGVDDVDGAELPCGVHVLRHDALPQHRLFGSAWTFWDTDLFAPPWAFGTNENDLSTRFRGIPEATEILVCHSGARGVLDNAAGREVGSTALATRLAELSSLKLLVHGHAHESERCHDLVGDALSINVAERLVAIDWDGDARTAAVDVFGRLDKEDGRWT